MTERPSGGAGRVLPGRGGLARPGRLLILVGLIILGALLAQSLWEAAGPRRFVAIEELATPAGWEVEGFHASPSPSARLDAPGEIRSFPRLMVWRSYTPELGMVAGRIASVPFTPPDYLAVPYAGFPGETPGNVLLLRCEANGAERSLATLRTNTQWAVAFMDLRGFCPGPVRFLAINETAATYTGIATPFAINRSTWFAHTQAGPRLLATVASWVILIILGYACLSLLRRLAPAIGPVPAAMIGMGVLGMVILTLLTPGPIYGVAAIWCAMAGSLAWLAFMALRQPDRLMADLQAAAWPLVIWLGAALAFTGLAAGADSGGGNWAINGMFRPVRWSSDNQLPIFFAEALLSNQPRDQILFSAPWLVTDRGPLLAALLAIPRVVLDGLGRHWGSSYNGHLYLSAAITIQSSWILLVPFLASHLVIRRPALLITVLLTSPFLLFNTLYVWPKLLGGIYVVICAILLFAPGAREAMRQRGVVPAIAAAAALAYLSHASNVFALVPIGVIGLPVLWQAGILRMAAGAGVGVLLNLPWLWWQVAIQPGATALLRYALALDEGLFRRGDPLWPDIVKYYRSLGWGGWLQAKLGALKMLAGLERPWMRMPEVATHAPLQPPLGTWRIADFFSLAWGLNVALLSVPLALLARVRGAWPAMARLSWVMLGLGLVSLLFTNLITVPLATLHVQPYGAVLLLLFGLLMIVDGLPLRLAWLVPALGVAYVLTVWVVPPLFWADRLVVSGVLGMLAGLAIAAGALLNLPRPADPLRA